MGKQGLGGVGAVPGTRCGLAAERWHSDVADARSSTGGVTLRHGTQHRVVGAAYRGEEDKGRWLAALGRDGRTGPRRRRPCGSAHPRGRKERNEERKK